jgi:hypothetical protein
MGRKCLSEEDKEANKANKALKTANDIVQQYDSGIEALTNDTSQYKNHGCKCHVKKENRC